MESPSPHPSPQRGGGARGPKVKEISTFAKNEREGSNRSLRVLQRENQKEFLRQ
jgi:hypothetical protein